MHTIVTSHRAEQHQDRDFLPQALRGRDINIGPVAIRATLPAYPKHCPTLRHLDSDIALPNSHEDQTIRRDRLFVTGEIQPREHRNERTAAPCTIASFGFRAAIPEGGSFLRTKQGVSARVNRGDRMTRLLVIVSGEQGIPPGQAHPRGRTRYTP